MISRTDNIICGPLNMQQNIYKLLFKDIGYSSKTLEDGFISRDVNFYENNKPTFSKIINDCQERPVFQDNKFKEVILDIKEEGEQQSENDIDSLIKNMESRVKSVEDKIINTYKKTKLLEHSLPENYRTGERISQEDKNILIKLNSVLENFSKNPYTNNIL